MLTRDHNFYHQIHFLRAIAVLSVLFFHIWPSYFPHGYLGVDIFFIISGFLIYNITQIERKQSLINFLSSRINRILPVYLIVIVFVTLLTVPILAVYEIEDFYEQSRRSISFTSNYLFSGKNDYFSDELKSSPFLHTWSISVEIQFYLIASFFIIFGKVSKNTKLLILVLLAITFTIYSFYMFSSAPSKAFYDLKTRIFQFLLGAITAQYCDRKKSGKNRAKAVASVLLTLLCLFLIISEIDYIEEFRRYLITAITCFYIILGSQNFQKNSITNYIADISYSVYLWHWPILVLTVLALGYKNEVVIILTTLFMSHMSFKFIERRFSKSSIFVSFSCLTLSLMIFFYFSNSKENLYKPFSLISPLYEHLLDGKTFNSTRVGSYECRDRLGISRQEEEVCHANSEIPEIAIVGDSMAMSLYTPFKERDLNKDSILVAAHGCFLTPRIEQVVTKKSNYRNNCQAISKRIINYINETNSINSVIISNGFPDNSDNMIRYLYDGEEISPVNAYFQGIRDFVDEIDNSEIEISVVISPPPLAKDPKTCISRLTGKIFSADCEPKFEDFRRTHAATYDKYKTLATGEKKITVFNSSDILCDSISCGFYDLGGSYYFDRGHFSTYGATRVIEKILLEGFEHSENKKQP